MQRVSYRGRRLAVVVHGDLALLQSELAKPGADRRLYRFVAAKCRFAMEIERGLIQGDYEDAAAERYARALLVPAAEFAALAALADAELAARFGVMADEVAARRRELRLGRASDERGSG